MLCKLRHFLSQQLFQPCSALLKACLCLWFTFSLLHRKKNSGRETNYHMFRPPFINTQIIIYHGPQECLLASVCVCHVYHKPKNKSPFHFFAMGDGSLGGSISLFNEQIPGFIKKGVHFPLSGQCVSFVCCVMNVGTKLEFC